LGRIRAKRHYAAHKDKVKLRVKTKYHDRKDEILGLIRERLRPQIEQAKTSQQYVFIQERQSKYRLCGRCFHYGRLKYEEQISPAGNLCLSIYCPCCRRERKTLIYRLSE
jgi:hypothetical protein